MTYRSNFRQVDESKFFTFCIVGSITKDYKWTNIDMEQCQNYNTGQIVEIMTND